MGLNARGKQGFIGVDVANAGHQGLVEQGIFDGPDGTLELLLQVGGVERRTEGFRPKPL